MNQRNQDSATGSAYRVTECDRATIDIDPTLIPLKHLANRKRPAKKAPAKKVAAKKGAAKKTAPKKAAAKKTSGAGPATNE